MKKIAVVFALLGAASAPHPALAQDAKIEVSGITVGKKLTPAQKDVFMFTSEGTRLQVTVSLPGRTFIGADRQACKFEKFSDDKGTELFAPLGHAPEADDWLGWFGPKFSEDGKTCGLTVEAPGLPAKDATLLTFNGSLVLRCGTQPKTAEQKNVAIKKSTKISAGPVPFEIGATSASGAQTKLDLKAKSSLDRIIAIKFFDAAGKEIGSRREGYESSSFLGAYEVTSSYVLSRKVTAVTVKVSYFEKVEPITVPIKVDAGVGF